MHPWQDGVHAVFSRGQGVCGQCKNPKCTYITCLKLLAATLVIQTFAKVRADISILLRIDDKIAVTYINHLEGTASRELISLTRELWMWWLEWNINITV